MRELSDKFKISARSLGEVAEAINTMVSRFRTTGDVTYLDKNLTREALINAAILYVDSLPQDRKVKAVSEGIARLEALIRAEDGEGATLPVSPPRAGAVAPDFDPGTGDLLPKPGKRKKRG